MNNKELNDNLMLKLTEFDELYFEDMLLYPNSFMGKYINPKMTRLGTLLESNNISIIIEDQLKYEVDAYFDEEEFAIYITTSNAADETTLLHEMIHAHEILLSKMSSTLRDSFVIELYKHLKTRISMLDELILFHSYLDNIIKMKEISVEHSLLFFLKSLDLDLKTNKELLTTFGYNYKDAYKECKIL